MKPNNKEYMKYHIGKDLYDLFDYSIFYPLPRGDIEFFTQRKDYENIWSILKTGDYGYCQLNSMEYSNVYDCYVVDVSCPDLQVYLKHFHNYRNPVSEKVWKSRALDCNWSVSEVNEGYQVYKGKCDSCFSSYYGEHVYGLGHFVSSE